MVKCQATNARAVSLRGRLLAGVSAVAFCLAAWTTPGVAAPPHPPAETCSGTARAYLAIGIATTDVGLSEAATQFSSNRAFTQWAGITGGLTESFYDFYSVPVAACRPGYFPATDTGNEGWFTWGYTAQLGGGLSATLATEARRNITNVQGIYVPPLSQDIPSISFDLGGAWSQASTNTTSAVSAGGADALMPGPAGTATGNNFVAGVGVREPLAAFVNGFTPVSNGAYGGPPDIVGNLRVDQTWGGAQTRAASNQSKPAPLVATPNLIPIGVLAQVDFFVGENAVVHGIPSGPFGTANGGDNFKFEDKLLLRTGGWFAVPIAANLRVEVSGGYAGLDRSVTLGCQTYCAVAPATAPFTDTKYQWLNGGFVGGGLELGWRGMTFGVHYTHVFLGNDTETLGNPTTRAVTENTSGDINMVTGSVSVPLRSVTKLFLP